MTTTISITVQLADLDQLDALLKTRAEGDRPAAVSGLDADGYPFLAVRNEVDEIGVTYGDEEWQAGQTLTFPVVVLLRSGEQ